jgi:hypothetical protein
MSEGLRRPATGTQGGRAASGASAPPAPHAYAAIPTKSVTPTPATCSARSSGCAWKMNSDPTTSATIPPGARKPARVGKDQATRHTRATGISTASSNELVDFVVSSQRSCTPMLLALAPPRDLCPPKLCDRSNQCNTTEAARVTAARTTNASATPDVPTARDGRVPPRVKTLAQALDRTVVSRICDSSCRVSARLRHRDAFPTLAAPRPCQWTVPAIRQAITQEGRESVGNRHCEVL